MRKIYFVILVLCLLIVWVFCERKRSLDELSAVQSIFEKQDYSIPALDSKGNPVEHVDSLQNRRAVFQLEESWLSKASSYSLGLRIEAVSLHGTVHPEDIRKLKSLPNLSVVILSGDRKHLPVFDSSLSLALSGLPLRGVEIVHYRLDELALPLLSEMPYLETLHIFTKSPTDFSSIGSFRKLRTLAITGSALEFSEYDYSTNINHLVLTHCSGVDTIDFIRLFPRLVSLEIEQSFVSVSFIESLTKLHDLDFLCLRNCSYEDYGNLSREALRRLNESNVDLDCDLLKIAVPVVPPE